MPKTKPAPDDIWIEYVDLEEIQRWPRNPKGHALDQIGASFTRFGYVDPMIKDENTGKLVGGHGRLDRLEQMKAKGEPPPQRIQVRNGKWLVPVVRGVSFKNEQEALAYLLATNRLVELGGWRDDDLGIALKDLGTFDGSFLGTGFSIEDLKSLTPGGDMGAGARAGALRDRFIVPPFSVLDARQGYWQDRKRSWIDLGIRSEEGRGDNLLNFSDAVQLSKKINGKKGKAFSTQGTLRRESVPEEKTGTSIFDPVLCELLYKWFSPPGGAVLDPFAGGSVRGVVAAYLGRPYVGVDLRAEQVQANKAQWSAILQKAPPEAKAPRWVEGDSKSIGKLASGKYDFIFSCPPYADLERYSDDPRDISTMPYDDFLEAYRAIIAASARMLAPNRFACFVVGEVRGPQAGGAYYRFVPDTIDAFKGAGLAYYNEAILVTAIGTLPLRIGRQFQGSRKLGKTHQNVLVFVKGDPTKAASACGPVDVDLPTAEAPAGAS